MKISVGKWGKYKVMKLEERLLAHLPETQLLSEKRFWDSLRRHKQVIIKPCRGFRGRRVSQVSWVGDEEYEIHVEDRKITLTGKVQMSEYLHKKFLNKRRYYVVQQRIPLAVIDGCPFDLRVMVQRKKDESEWEVTGKLAKVAARGFMITNVAKSILSVEKAIKESSIRDIALEDLLMEMNSMALITAEHLMEYYPKRRTIGLDLGLDEEGKIWIIEANFTPTLSIFLKLNDKTVYEKIKMFRDGSI